MITITIKEETYPYGKHPYWSRKKEVDYWHERCKKLGAAWSRQRTEFMLKGTSQ